MLSRVQELRERLDAVREGRVQNASFWARTLARLSTSGERPTLERLRALSRAFDRAGLRTRADVLLLRSLGVRTGRAAGVATGLGVRSKAALEEFEDALLRAERALLKGAPLPGLATLLEAQFPELVRVCRTASLFAEAVENEALPVLLTPTLRHDGEPPRSAALALAEFYSERARLNLEDVAARKRDLDRAHEVLLRIDGKLDDQPGTEANGAGAATRDERGTARERMLRLRRDVADARARIRDVPSTRSLPELLRLVRRSTGEDPRRAWRALHGLYERAVEAGEERLAEAAAGALNSIAEGDSGVRAQLEAAAAVLENAPKPPEEDEEEGTEAALTDLAFELTPEALETFELAAGCARFFDVEASLAEEVQEGRASRAPPPRRVPYPTPQMIFEPTGRLDSLHNLVITDPRRLVLDLASHQQLVRVYLEEVPAPEKKTVKRSAVRVYVLDASGSMYGARARFRDAILISEFNNLRAKARRDEPLEPLYYSFFNDTPTELTRIDSAAAATRHVRKLFEHSPASGQTDISLAVMSAFESIRAAQGRDPHLARATVVVITDGEDKVDLELIRKIRAPLDGLEISLSFIALGEENPDLRTLAHEQREQGARAFYHHLSDEEIAWAQTGFDTPWRTLLPAELDPESLSPGALEPHLQALEEIARDQPLHAPVVVDASFDALFPESPPELPGAARVPEELTSRVLDMLTAILEVAPLAPMEKRAGEAVVLLEHLRGVYALPLETYLQALHAPEVAGVLGKVRLLCAPLT